MPPRPHRSTLRSLSGTALCLAGALLLAKGAFDSVAAQQAAAGRIVSTREMPAASHAGAPARRPGDRVGTGSGAVEPEVSDSTSLAELEIVRNGSASDVYVRNRLAGPLEINLGLTESRNVRTIPSLPLTQLLPSMQRVLVSRVEPGDGQVASYALRMAGVPGDPTAMPDEVVYSLPVDENGGWELGQGFHGGFSHTDEENRFAVDLIIPIGTPVLAARDGVVMQVQSGYDRAGLDRKKFSSRANVVRVLHEDGSMAIYAHLKENSVFVKVGERVSVGQEIALSGNTGFSSGPHLHFCLQVNRGMHLVSVPFRMVTAQGYLPIPH